MPALIGGTSATSFRSDPGAVIALAFQVPALLVEAQQTMHQAQVFHEASGKAARVFVEFSYQTRKSWSCARRVVAKAVYLDKGENPRFVVTSLANELTAFVAQGDNDPKLLRPGIAVREHALSAFTERRSRTANRSPDTLKRSRSGVANGSFHLDFELIANKEEVPANDLRMIAKTIEPVCNEANLQPRTR